MNCVIRNLLQTVQADEHRGLPLPEALGRQPHDLVEVLAGRGRRLADDRLKDAREDGERRPVLLAVDVDRAICCVVSSISAKSRRTVASSSGM